MATKLLSIFVFIFLLSYNVRARGTSLSWHGEHELVSSPTQQKSEVQSHHHHHHVHHGKCEDMRMSGLSLNFRKAGLRRVDSDFASSPNLSCLNLEDNEIVYVSPNATRSTPHLAFLNLARNNLSIGNLTDFYGHPALLTIVLDGNNRTADDEGATLKFDNVFSRLMYFYARECNIKDVPSLKFAPRITHLYLSSNNLGESELTFLDDASNTLTDLDLANNSIRSLNASKLASVHFLNLHGNEFKKVCGKSDCRESGLILEGATELHRLHLSSNNIVTIDSDAFDDTEDLYELDLSNNRIDHIGKSTFERVGDLHNLSLSGNMLSEMPDLCGPESLEYLSLANNQLEVIGNEAFCLINRTRVIDLSNNKIKTIEPDAFKKMIYLDILKLTNNRLRTLPRTWLSTLMSLKMLHVDGNRLQSLYDLALDSVRYSNLKIIYLQNNPIKRIYSGTLYNAPYKNITIELFGNETSIENTETCKCECDERGNEDIEDNEVFI